MAVFYIFLAALAMVHSGSLATDSQCSSNIRSVGLSISSTKNDSGQWTDLFSARTEHSSALHSITMDVLHNITECDGRRVIHIQASIQKGRDQFSRKEKLENGSGGDCTEGCGGRDEIKAEEEINGTENGRKLQQEANSTDKGKIDNKNKNDSGQCTYLLSARTEDSITMDVMHNITECDGRRVIRIQGSFRKADEPAKGMVFHSKFGSNVLIINNGRTIVKKDIDEYKNGTAFTSRPLENDELFEVSLDKKGSKFSGGFGIGVMTIKPEDFKFPSEAYDSPHAWMYEDKSIWNNGTCKRYNYGVDINDLPAGTRFGVMRKSSSGDVHFYIDRIDRGSALSGISGPIYGVADLRYNAEKITILNP